MFYPMTVIFFLPLTLVFFIFYCKMYHLLYIGSPQRKQIIAGVNSIVSGKMYKMLSFVFQQAVEQCHLKNTLSITMIIPFNTKFSTILIRTMMVYSRHQNTWMPRSWQWTTTVRFDVLLLYFHSLVLIELFTSL